MLHHPVASCPRNVSTSLPPLIEVCFPPWVGGTFITMISQSYIHANHCIYPQCAVCRTGTNEYAARDMWTLPRWDSQQALYMAHWGAVAGSLPHWCRCREASLKRTYKSGLTAQILSKVICQQIRFCAIILWYGLTFHCGWVSEDTSCHRQSVSMWGCEPLSLE